MKRYPGAADVINGPSIVCQSDAGHNFTAAIEGADSLGYEWVLLQESSGMVLFDSVNAGNSIPIQFSMYPTGNLMLKVRGHSESCGYGPFGPGINGEGMRITVKPSPAITNAVTTFGICSTGMTDIALTSSALATTFEYTATATAPTVSGYSGGSLNPIQQMLTNSAPETDTVIYRVVPFADGCVGDTAVFFVKVSPQPQVINTQYRFSQCSGVATAIALQSNYPGAGFNWTAVSASPVITGYYNFSEILIAQVLNNPGPMVDSVTYTVTPDFGGCLGPPVDFWVTVIPGQTVSVTVSHFPDTVCEGESMTFTAVAINGGVTPFYEWFVNGVNLFSGSSVFTYTPNNDDVVMVHCQSSIVNCVSNNPATSPPVTMVVNSSLPAEITIAASANPFCPGAVVNFTATPVNGGSNPSYQWKVNGINAGSNSSSFSYVPATNDSVRCVINSNLSCVTGNPANSANIIMIGSLAPNVAFSACFDTVTTVNAKPFQLKGGLPLGGTYYGPGVNSSTGIFTPSVAGIGVKTINYSYINVHDCVASKSKSIVVQPYPSFTCGNNFVDPRDNKVYPTVQIGSQCWMQKSLDYGITILDNTPQTDNCIAERYLLHPSSVVGPSSFYQWDELVQYQTAEGSQGLCPPGWHVPTETDWATLMNYYQGNGRAGRPLQDTIINGFKALRNGVFYLNSNWSFLDFATLFWSSALSGSTYPVRVPPPRQGLPTLTGSNWALAHGMNLYNFSVSLYPASRANAFPVRCIRD